MKLVAKAYHDGEDAAEIRIAKAVEMLEPMRGDCFVDAALEVLR